jgi:hypothetical protein
MALVRRWEKVQPRQHVRLTSLAMGPRYLGLIYSANSGTWGDVAPPWLWPAMSSGGTLPSHATSYLAVAGANYWITVVQASMVASGSLFTMLGRTA